MPYIEAKFRDEIEAGSDPMTPGEVNFAITRICNRYLLNFGESYTHYNDLIGVLEAVKLELYRRLVAPYEDQKRHQNGDVYDVQRGCG